MSTAITLHEVKSVAQVQAQRTAIVELMRHAMEADQDYGTIPGTNKPTLYKPGSEKLMSMFHLAGEPIVEDLSTPDTMRFRVMLRITEMGSGRYLGSGVGEASSAEEKYQWRAAVCREEWEATPEDRRRTKWKKSSSGAYSIQQVRTSMEDQSNTVLKMAKKRAQIDAVLTVTAASDVFSQDLEPEEQGGNGGQPSTTGTAKAQPQATQQSQPAGNTTAASGGSGDVISQAQATRFYAIWKGAGRDPERVKEYLQSVCGVSDSRKMPKECYDAACTWAAGKE